MIEEWRDVKGYEGLYQVSNLGRVKSLEKYVSRIDRGVLKTSFYPEKIFKTRVNTCGDITIDLTKDKVRKSYLVHRLVAIAFIPNPENLPVINHKDEVKTNNVVSNLEWCTKLYNNIYNDKAKKTGLKQSISILQYDLKGNFIKEWVSTRDAARGLGGDRDKNDISSNITKVLKGKYKYCYGFIWRYK